jgi:hypothetical protein
MNTLTTDELQPHITILGWLYLIGHAVFLVLGVFIFLLLTGIGLASGDMTARSVLGIVGISVGLLLTIVALPGLAAGYGLLTRKTWARPLAIVVGILSLPNVPLGTIVGLYTFWVLSQPPAQTYFAPPVTI